MARLGVDFGTTNTVAMIHDRGIFSEVLHSVETGAGTIVQATFPSVILLDRNTGRRWYGIEADRRFGRTGLGDDLVFISSLKSRLRHYVERSAPNAGGATEAGDCGSDPAELLRGFLEALASSIRRSQSIPDGEPLEAVITWPANANGAQRYITRRCFRDAGFQVIDTLNEPTASAIELADCLTAGRGEKALDRPQAIAIFDLGGGTFDASVVWIDGKDFHVLASGGIEDLGGDDFDRVLFNIFLAAMDVPAEALSGLSQQALLRQARTQKETISSGVVKRLHASPKDYGLKGRAVSIRVETFLNRIRPMIVPAIETLRRVIADAVQKEPRVQTGDGLTVYLVGGSSKLPLVARMVSEAFPDDRVVLTDQPFRSVAMGAAISATEHVQYRDVFARHFGLIRLRDHGLAETFDAIFPAGTPIPRRNEPPLEKVALYHPRHNIGHLRYLECSSVGPDGMPAGSARAWSDILFSYDPTMPLSTGLEGVPIRPTDEFAGQAVCEVYRCDSDGVITVELRRPGCNDSRTYEVYRD